MVAGEGVELPKLSRHEPTGSFGGFRQALPPYVRSMLKLYPDPGWLRTRRLVTDLLVVAWSAAWVLIGVGIYRLVISLERVGDGVTGAGQKIDGIISAFRSSVPSGVPLVSSFMNQLSTSLERSSGRPLITLGSEVHADVARLAVALALAVAAPPLLIVSGRYLVRRWREVRELRAAKAFLDAAVARGEVPAVKALLAYRAVTTLSFAQIMRVSVDPVADLASGRHEELAAAELAHIGLSGKALVAPPPTR